MRLLCRRGGGGTGERLSGREGDETRDEAREPATIALARESTFICDIEEVLRRFCCANFARQEGDLGVGWEKADTKESFDDESSSSSLLYDCFGNDRCDDVAGLEG